MNKNPLEAFLGIINRLSLQQKLILGGAAGLTLIMMSALILFLNEPDYVPLYTKLSEEDASKILEELIVQKIPYQLDDNGRTIKVPHDKLYETRLSLAGKGLLSSGTAGYELFDKSTMGMSEFMQKLNFKRALEGELAKTIMQQDGVEGVRVHITLPAKSVFRDEEKLPTASVVLKLKNQNGLNRENVNAIVNLISSSVEGLQPGKVTLLDTKGRLLSRDNFGDPLAVSSTKQYEIKQSVENYLAQKAQRILDNILGYGNSMIQVNADLNFDQVERTMETYDPESQVAISEQTIKSENGGKNFSDSTSHTSENSTTNYEINKTIEKVISGTGNIKRLSIAAVVNDISREIKREDKTEIVTESRPPEQMKKLQEIIRNAVGIDENRNDQFTLVNLSFETKDYDDIVIKETSMLDNVDEWTNTILIVLAIGAAMFLLKGLMQKLKNEKIMIGSYNPGEIDYLERSLPELGGSGSKYLSNRKKGLLSSGDIEDEITDDAARKKIRQDKIANYVSKNPVEAAKLINAWLHEDELQ